MLASVVSCQGHNSAVFLSRNEPLQPFFGLSARGQLNHSQSAVQLDPLCSHTMDDDSLLTTALPSEAGLSVSRGETSGDGNDTGAVQATEDDRLSEVTLPENEGTGITQGFGNPARNYWRVTTSPCGNFKQVEQDMAGFKACAFVMKPDDAWSGDNLHQFEDDYGIKWEIYNVHCMSCKQWKAWQQMSRRAKQWTNKACRKALQRRANEVQGENWKAAGRILCEACCHPLPGENSMDYLVRLEQARCIRTSISVELFVDVYPGGHEMFETLDHPDTQPRRLSALHHPSVRSVADIFDRAARLTEQQWQEELDLDNTSSSSSESSESDTSDAAPPGLPHEPNS